MRMATLVSLRLSKGRSDLGVPQAWKLWLEHWRNEGFLPEAPLKSLPPVANDQPTGQEPAAPGKQTLTACLSCERHCGEREALTEPIPGSFFHLFILLLNYLSALTVEDLPGWAAAVPHHSGLLGKSIWR